MSADDTNATFDKIIADYLEQTQAGNATDRDDMKREDCRLPLRQIRKAPFGVFLIWWKGWRF